MRDDIHELNKRRCEAAETLRILGYGNQPLDPAERLKSDARYRLAQDAVTRTERDYAAALASLSTQELMSLSYPSVTEPKENAAE